MPALSRGRTSPARFRTRLPPEAVVLRLSPQEVALAQAFDAFRTAIRTLIASGEASRRRAGTFAVEMLGKRLLSCPVAFAESWRRCREGLADERTATEDEVESARRAVEREAGDDPETQAREATAAGVVGAWVKKIADALQTEIVGIDEAVAGLGFGTGGSPVETDPIADARFDALAAMVERLLRSNGAWRDDERLVVFTEYKTTLDYPTRPCLQPSSRAPLGSAVGFAPLRGAAVLTGEGLIGRRRVEAVKTASPPAAGRV